jgi:hypothetical protein
MRKETYGVKYGVTLQLRTEEVGLSSNVPGSVQYESWPNTRLSQSHQQNGNTVPQIGHDRFFLSFIFHYSVTIFTLRL